MLHNHPGLVTKCSVIPKISSGQTFTDILNLCCDLDLKRSNLIFPQDTPAYDDVPSKHLRRKKSFHVCWFDLGIKSCCSQWYGTWCTIKDEIRSLFQMISKLTCYNWWNLDNPVSNEYWCAISDETRSSLFQMMEIDMLSLMKPSHPCSH